MLENKSMISSENKFKKTYKIYIIVFLFLIVSCLIIIFTSAKDIDIELSGSDKVNVAKWNIKVLDGYTKQSATQGVNFVTNDNKSNVASGHIAPGSTAVAEIILDPTGSQVAIDYTISIDTSISETRGLVISSFYNNNKKIILDENNSYSGSLTLSQVQKNSILTFKIIVKWENKEENNYNDTLIGQNAKTITIPVTITAQQHVD